MRMLFVLLITRVSNETNRTCQIAYDLFFGAEENTRQSLPVHLLGDYSALVTWTIQGTAAEW